MNLPVYYFLTTKVIIFENKRMKFHSPLLVEGVNIIIDSGASLMVLPINFYEDLVMAIMNSIDQITVRDFKDWWVCYFESFEMPKIAMYFKGTDVS